MRNLSKLILTLLSFLCVSQYAGAVPAFNNETLKYVISYKWGLIHKDAGEATLSLKQKNGIYDILLTARTKPWADKIYQVRDTLKATVNVTGLLPLKYEKLTHEKGKYKKDIIVYSRQGDVTKGMSKRYRDNKGKWDIKEASFSATGPVYDMLSIFYYLRSLDFSGLNKNKTYTATVFSGKRKETIKVKCLGIEKIKLKDKIEKEAYHIQFNFTREGGKKSSEDMDTWISTDSSHTPLRLVGKLPIGEIRATLIN